MIWLSEIKYVKVWNVEQKERFTKGKLQTSEKKQDGTYEKSDWFCAFVGNCAPLAKELSDGDAITVNKAKITNVYNKEQKKSYFNMAVFDFEITSKGKQKDAPAFDEDDFSSFKQVPEDDCPF